MRRVSFLVVLLLATSLAACSSGHSPASPSDVSPAGGATVTGSFTAGGGNEDSAGGGPAAGTIVSVLGTSLSVTVDTAGRFTMTNVPAGTIQLQITGAAFSAVITINDVKARETIALTLTVTGSTVTVVSEARDDHSGGTAVELAGVVSGLTGACPAVTFTVGTQTVQTTAQTEFDDGRCTNVVNGARVKIKGSAQPDGTVLARKVSIEDDEDDEEVEVKGVVSGLTGACPAITFTVGTRTVVTTAQTAFDDGGCASVVNGAVVEAEGTLQPDGSILARKVSVEDDDDEVEVKGLVSGLTGACPSITFTIGTRTITATAQTRFEDGDCASVVNGALVEVEGTLQADGSILARKISVEDDDEVEVKGVVSGLTGACPAITFTIGTRTIATTAQTRFEDGSCAAVTNGTKVEVSGTIQPNGTLVARRVEIDD